MLNKTRIAGVVSHPLGRNAGRSSLNGSGTCVWNWVISFILIRCARPSLLLLSRLCAKRRLTRLLPLKDMRKPPWLCPGKLAASLVKTLLFNRMARCAVRLDSRWSPMSDAEKPMGACASCMRPASSVVAPVLYESLANGRATPPRSRSPRECAVASIGRRFSAHPLA